MREVLSLLAWVGAFGVGFLFSHRLADALIPYIKTPSFRVALAFFLLFLFTFLFISLINYCVSLLINRVGLSGVDKACGALVGIARGILLVGLILLLARLTPLPQGAWWQHALLIPKFAPVENWLKGFMPDYIEKQTVMTD